MKTIYIDVETNTEILNAGDFYKFWDDGEDPIYGEYADIELVNEADPTQGYFHPTSGVIYFNCEKVSSDDFRELFNKYYENEKI